MATFQFQDFFESLERVGFMDFLLPFLLIFTILFAVLDKTKILGEGRKIYEVETKKKHDVDLSILNVFPYVLPTYMYTDFKDENTIKMYTTNKIIKYPVFLKKVIENNEGVIREYENIAFDPLSGEALITRTTGGFDGLTLDQSGVQDGSYYHYKIPASHIYSGMGKPQEHESEIIKSGYGGNQENAKFFRRHFSDV